MVQSKPRKKSKSKMDKSGGARSASACRGVVWSDLKIVTGTWFCSSCFLKNTWPKSFFGIMFIVFFSFWRGLLQQILG